MGESVTDDDFLSILDAISRRRWKSLWAVVDAAEAAGTLWEITPTTVVATMPDGTQDLELACVDYGPELDALHERLYALGLVVSTFDWGRWANREFEDHPPTVAGIKAGSVSDAVRLLTVILRSHHFDDGALAAHWRDGSLPAVLERIRCWQEEDRVGDDSGSTGSTRRLRQMTPKAMERATARSEGCAKACSVLVDQGLDIPADVRRKAIMALVRYATPKRVMRPGDLCSEGVGRLGVGGLAPDGDAIQFEHVLPVRVLADRIAGGDDPRAVLDLAVVAFVLRSEHEHIGPLVAAGGKHGDLYQRLLAETLEQLRTRSRERYTNVGLELFTVDADWQFRPEGAD